MTEEELYEKYALEPEEAPVKVCSMSLPYHFDAVLKKYAEERERWVAEVHNYAILPPGIWQFINFTGDTLEQVVHDVRAFIYRDECDSEEPSLDWLWNHGFKADADNGEFVLGNLRVRSKPLANRAGAIRIIIRWGCQAIIDGKKTPAIKAATAREAVELVCKEYGLEMPE